MNNRVNVNLHVPFQYLLRPHKKFCHFSQIKNAWKENIVWSLLKYQKSYFSEFTKTLKKERKQKQKQINEKINIRKSKSENAG